MAESAESTLTEAQKRRLGELSAEAMGYRAERNPRSGEIVGWHTEDALLIAFDSAFAPGNFHSVWHPWEDLNQAAMVATKLGRWELSHTHQIPPLFQAHIRMLAVARWAHGYGSAAEPAKALFLAVAEACEWEYGDD